MSHALEHARRFTAPRHVAGLFCASLALALAAPSSQSHIFAGLPLSRAAEFFALIVLLPFLVSTAVRRTLARAFAHLPGAGRAVILALPAVVLGLKAVLLIIGSPVGYSACYWRAFVLGSGPVLSAFVPVGVHGLPVIWLCCAWYCMREGSPISRLVYLVPVAYLGVHLFFQVDAYYPRHIVIGYESAGLAAAILLRRRTQTPFEPSPWSHTRRAPPVMSS